MISAISAQTKLTLPIDGVLSMTLQHNPSLPLTLTGLACLLNISSPSSPMIKGLQELVCLAADIRVLGWRFPSAAELYSFTERRTYAN